MRRAFFIAALGLLCAGCFESDNDLYQGTKPLQPFQSGPVTNRDKDGKTAPMMLTLEAGGVYRLTPEKPAPGSSDMILVRFFPLDGAPRGILVVEAKDCEKESFKKCLSDKSYDYELVRVVPGGMEWRDPDCSKTFSKMAGVTVTIDSCKFDDRASLEKALRVAAALPWQTDGTYLLH
jgi:hypothetical protein